MRTLVSYLNERHPRELEALAQRWEISLGDRPSGNYSFHLAIAMQSEFLQRRVVEKLKAEEQKLLRLYLRQPNYTANLDELHEEAKFDPDELAIALSRLTEFGLFFYDKIKTTEDDRFVIKERKPRRDNWRNSLAQADLPNPQKLVLVVPRELARSLNRLLTEREASEKTGIWPSRQPLPTLLTNLGSEELEQQAEIWGLIGLVGSARPEELTRELAQMMSSQSQQEQVLGQLSAVSRELFETLRKQGGRTTLAALQDKFGSFRQLARRLQPLTEQRLVWEAFEAWESLVFIPEEILKPQTGSVHSAAAPLQTVTPPASITPYPPYAMAWDVLSFLNYLSQHEVLFTVKHEFAKRDLKKIAARFWQPETEIELTSRTAFLLYLCSGLKLYQTKSGESQVVPGPALQEWLSLDFYEQMNRLTRYWLEENTWYYFYLFGYPAPYNSYTAIQVANKAVLGLLTDCEPGTWYSFEALLNKVQRENPYFIFSRRELLQSLGGQRLSEMSKNWRQSEGEVIRRVMGGLLEWFGVVQIGRDPSEQIVAFSLTEFGAALSQRPAAALPKIPFVEKPLLVQPNFEVLLLAPQVETLWQLLQFSDVKKFDQVSLFTLSREASLRGIETGLSIETMLEWLESQSIQPLPQNLQMSLRDWSGTFKRVNLETAILLEVETPAMLDELITSKVYAAYFVRRLSPTAAIMQLPAPHSNRTTDPLKPLKNKLRAGGYFVS